MRAQQEQLQAQAAQLAEFRARLAHLETQQKRVRSETPEGKAADRNNGPAATQAR